MPLPLTVSCFSKIQTGFTFLVPAHLGSPGQRAVKWCVYVNKVKWKTYCSFLQNEIWCHSLFPSCFICDFLWKLFLVCVGLPVTVLNCAYALTSFCYCLHWYWHDLCKCLPNEITHFPSMFRRCSIGIRKCIKNTKIPKFWKSFLWNEVLIVHLNHMNHASCLLVILVPAFWSLNVRRCCCHLPQSWISNDVYRAINQKFAVYFSR